MSQNPDQPWETADGIDRCDKCQNHAPLRSSVDHNLDPKLAEIYPDGRPGHFCQPCFATLVPPAPAPVLPNMEPVSADAMIAHRWFATEFGEVFNGRDFAVKCPMASWKLTTLRQELDGLRRLLFLQHPCSGKYGDDGEMQCGSCLIDFKRDEVETIHQRLQRRAEAILTTQSAQVYQSDAKT